MTVKDVKSEQVQRQMRRKSVAIIMQRTSAHDDVWGEIPAKKRHSAIVSQSVHVLTAATFLQIVVQVYPDDLGRVSN